MATEQEILKASKSLGWRTSFQLADHFGLANDRAAFRTQLNELVESGEMIKGGRGKGTRYAVRGTDPGDLPISKPSKPAQPKAKKRAKRTAKSKGEKVCKGTGLKAPPRGDTKRGARLLRKAAPTPAPELEALSIESESSDASFMNGWTDVIQNLEIRPEDQELDVPQLSVPEAFALHIGSMKRGKRAVAWDVSNGVADKYKLSHNKCAEFMMDLIRYDDPGLYADRENQDGLRLVVWRPHAGEVRPDRFLDLGARQAEIPLGSSAPRARGR